MAKWHYYCRGERIASVDRDDIPKIGDPVIVVGRAPMPAPAENFVFASIKPDARLAELDRR